MLSKNKAKFVRSLQLRKYRQKYHKIVVEGVKIVNDLISEELAAIDTICATTEWLSANDSIIPSNVEVVEASQRDLEMVSSFKTANEVLAVIDMPPESGDLGLASKELCLYLDSVRDPGNVGTIIRTADWYGIRNVFLSPDSVDIYNPKVIQASMSSVFRIRPAYIEPEVLVRDSSILLVAAALDGEDLHSIGPLKQGVLVVGNESTGIRPDLLSRADQTVRISGERKLGAESLNVAIATAIILDRLV